MLYVKEGRTTPKYKGYFVSFWKKDENNSNIPYIEDEVEHLVVKTLDGYIDLSKEYLMHNKILKTKKNKGKLGFRIKIDDPHLILKTKKQILSEYPVFDKII